MEFSLFLSCYFPDTTQPAARMYGQMLEMGQAAEQLGYCGVTVPEHHMINILMKPCGWRSTSETPPSRWPR